MNNELALVITRGAKRIKVNENGEYITLNFDDQAFLPRFLNLLQEVENMAAEGEAKEAELQAMAESNDKELFAKISAKANYDLQLCRELGAKIDAAFNDAVCRKVFGDIVPSVTLYAEFFAQLKTMIEGFANESKTKMQKYTEKYGK